MFNSVFIIIVPWATIGFPDGNKKVWRLVRVCMLPLSLFHCKLAKKVGDWKLHLEIIVVGELKSDE